jgi:hypothetical protein
MASTPERHKQIGCALCLFSTSERWMSFIFWCFLVIRIRGLTVKKIAFGTAVILALLSVAGCAQVGKGKAPPPVVTKG